jgi:glycine cleavage system aminomethyltransferase T
VGSLTTDDISNEGFAFATCREITLGPLRVLASRISYVGDLGWELYVPMEQGLRLWDLLFEAGEPHGAVPVGVGVYLTSGRLEKSYRAHGNELELEYDLLEAGMARRAVKDQDFVGKPAYLRQCSEEPVAVLCTLTVDDPTSASGVKRYMLGREPILSPDGEPLVDAHGRRSYATSAGSMPSVGSHGLMSYLPPEQAVVGTKLSVLYFGERYPVTVVAVGPTPVFDAANERLKS